LDDHASTVIENRIIKPLATPFKLVDDKGEISELTSLIKKPWFLEFMRYALMPQFTGTKIIELYDLNEKGELKEITLIPDTHIFPSKKMILKEAGNPDNGWHYDKPPLSNYYLQLGKDKELGVMEKLAVAILFKKMAVGSWLDYIDKYGVPPRWVLTDREDDERLDQLYDMMKEMMGSHFAVLRGQEKIEIMPSPGTDAHEVFNKFIDRMDAGISKRIMGATGTVDEKAYVGSAKVHQDVAEARHWSDKFYLEFLINEELLPRLITLSPAYSGLANLRFEFDETDDLEKGTLIDKIISMASQFNMDIEAVKEMTGLPILSQKGATEETAPEEKKKSR
jgi:hypothetical protein